MSATMFLGRVVLPGAGLIVAAVLAWQSVRDIAGRTAPAPRSGPAARSAHSSGWIMAEGRVVAYPGAQITVATEVLGTITKMAVRDKAAIHKGDLLVELRSDEVKAALREAHHRLTEAEVALRLEQTRSRLDRILPVVTGKEPQPPETRRELLVAALARRDAAKAAVDRVDAEIAKYQIVAPIDGVVIARYANFGETVTPASPLVTIADLNRLRIEAEVDEFDIASMFPARTGMDYGRGLSRSSLAGRGGRDCRCCGRPPDASGGSRPAGRYAGPAREGGITRVLSLEAATTRRGRNRRPGPRREASQEWGNRNSRNRPRGLVYGNPLTSINARTMEMLSQNQALSRRGFQDSA